jgi:hypothetical protein
MATRVGLNWIVNGVNEAIIRLAEASAREDVRVQHYGAFDIHPRYLVFWICVKTDSERDRLRGDESLMASLRQVLVDCDYPAEGRNDVHIGFESQETVDRDSDGSWYHHWK